MLVYRWNELLKYKIKISDITGLKEVLNQKQKSSPYACKIIVILLK